MKKKKEKGLDFEIEIPQDITLNLEGHKIILKKDNKEVSNTITKVFNIENQGNKIKIFSSQARKENKRLLGSIKSHIKNMIDGLNKSYEYELEICNVHFPITLTFDKAKGEFIVKNILGERYPRIIKAINPEKIEVEIKAPHIKIKSYDLEIASQNAANLEKLTKIRDRDRNKFQDGIFITKKPGRSFV